MEKLGLRIAGMSCGHCVARVTKALGRLPGVNVEHVEVGAARLGYDPTQVGPALIVKAIDELGFKAQPAA